jgi:hypothetical protein
MLNWMNPQWQARHGGAGSGGMPAAAGWPAGGSVGSIGSPADQWFQKYMQPSIFKPRAGGTTASSPDLGTWVPNPNYRNALAQIMAPQQQYPYAGGPNYGSQGGSGYGGYTTSGPQSGGSGSVGGWGWGGGARSSATQGGMWGGLR